MKKPVRVVGRGITPWLAVALAFGISCGDDDELDDDVARVACGSPVASDQPCCPVSWEPAGRCSSERANARCWRECHRAGLRDENDASVSVRGQLFCESDGHIGAGLGLFDCTPDP